MKLFKLPLALAAVLSLLVVSAPAMADNTHTDINLTCTVDPTTANTPADVSCSFVFNDNGTSFGTTNNDKVDEFSLEFEDAQVNEDENAPGAGEGDTDPAHNAKIGETTVAGDFGFDGCGDANDGGTYSTYWTSYANWTSTSAPTDYTKVAEYRTEFRVFFFFTEQVPTHVYQHDTTGEYLSVTDVPEGRGCAGAETTFDPMTIWSHAGNNSSNPYVGKNPASAGCYTVTITATEVGGTTHSDTTTVAIGGASC